MKKLRYYFAAFLTLISSGFLAPLTAMALSDDRLYMFAENNIYFYDPDGKDKKVNCGLGGMGSGLNYAGAEVFSQAELEAVAANQPFYEEAGEQYGLPWQILAVIHRREHGLARDNPGNGQGAYQLYSYTDGGTNSNAFLPAGPIDDAEFQRQTNIAAEVLMGKASGLDLSTDAGVKTLFFRYNGAADVYVQQAKSLGFSDEEARTGEGSPYVMNRYDEQRDPTVEPTASNNTWGQIKKDNGSIEYPANNEFGAYVMFVALGGSSLECSGSGELVSGGMDLAQAQSFMAYYKSEAEKYSSNNGSSVVLDGATLIDYESCYNALTNCVAFSKWFAVRYAGLSDVGLPDGKLVVGALSTYGFQTGSEPRPYAIFSGSGSTSMGHTGVVLGIDEANNKIIVGEAGCIKDKDSALNYIGAKEKDLSTFRNGSYTYAYTDGRVTGI